jgi:REP-associated tyrosine transposase
MTTSWVHETFPERQGFAWQTAYGAFAVSYSHLDRVKAYLARQAKHHRRRSFKEEFIQLLDRHDIDYDERYLWE